MSLKTFKRENKVRLRRIEIFLAGLAFGQFMVWMTWPIPRISVELYPEMTEVVSPWGRIKEAHSIPKVFVVTPTYRRPNQLAELTRLAQAIYPARHFVEWLIIDEREKSSEAHVELLRNFMSEFNISGVVLRSALRKVEVVKKGAKPKYRDPAKGVAARRAGIHYLRKKNLKGVLYFADDDNTYDSDIFRQMQGTQRISMWPVGCITTFVISSPVVKNGNIVGFYDGYQVGRKYAVDFAEFAVNLDVLHQNPTGNIPYRSGFEETIFLSSLGITKDEIEGLASGCTEVMAWHTKTVPINSRNLSKIVLPEDLKNSTIAELYRRYNFL